MLVVENYRGFLVRFADDPPLGFSLRSKPLPPQGGMRTRLQAGGPRGSWLLRSRRGVGCFAAFAYVLPKLVEFGTVSCLPGEAYHPSLSSIE